MVNLHEQPTSPLYPMTTMSESGALYDAPSPGPSAHTGNSTKHSVNLREDDDAFVNIAIALLERHKNKNLSAQDAVDSILLPHERRAFWEAVHFRISKLPMYAEVNEDPRNQVIREVERIFGKILRGSTDMASPTSQNSHVFDSRSPSSHIQSSASVPWATTQSGQPDADKQQYPRVPPTITMPHVDHASSSESRYNHSLSPYQSQQDFDFIDSNHINSFEGSPHRSDGDMSTGGRVPSLVSNVSVDTQPIQNLSSGDYYHHQQHQQIETSNQHDKNRSTARERTSPPRYKQFRPPSLQTQPSFVHVMAPPTHIDIDWNIPIDIVDETTMTFRDKSRGFQEGHESLPQAVNEKLQSPSNGPLDFNSNACNPVSPDWAPAISSHITDGENDKKSVYQQHTSTRPLPENDQLGESITITLEQQKKLLEEIDRVSKLLQEGNISDDTAARESYQNTMRVQLEKLNRAQQNSPTKRLPGVGENEDRPDGIVDPRFSDKGYYDSQIANQTQPSGGDDSRKKPLLPKQVVASDQFPDVRKQWRVVNVRAPYTLPEVSNALAYKILSCYLQFPDRWARLFQGFQFEARIGDEIFMATVPPGGVTQDEVFATRMGDIYGDSTNAAQRTRVFKDMEAPPSRWRDELFDCFRHGILHDFLWNSILCPHVALSQVMARIQLSDTGDPVITIRSRTRICWYVVFTLFLIGLHALYGCYMIMADPDGNAIIMATCPLVGLDLILLLYFLYMVTQTRRIVRREFDIPELRCHGHEDCCMAVFCTCCTIAQMGRHTADYETYQSYCCTETGLANHVEVKLPCEYLDDMELGLANNKRDLSRYSLLY